MKLSTICRTLFLASLLVGTAALADPELRRCIDPAGHVMLTDEPCHQDEVVAAPEPAAAEAADVAASTSPAADVVKVEKRLPRQRVQITPAAAARQSEWAKNAAGHRFSPDAETLKAARLNLQMRDDVSLAQRRQRLSGIN
ncbi:MAG: hypothetical protein H7Z39_19610 [Burkholderiaceae bacterium]|nr:hypothetical protein [Burkholderiaceae bacterium]